MELQMVVIIVVVIFVILAIGGGGMWWFWIASRPKKMTWKAYVYQVGEGVIKKRAKGKDGKPGQVEYHISDLKPYTTDLVIKQDKKDGSTTFWLQKLKKAVPPVTADCVEVWGVGNVEKFVRVVLDGGTCTLLKAGYDRKIAMQLFRPMPHDRISMIKTEISERKARIEDTRDILAQITPFVVAGISVLGLVVIAYFLVQGQVKIAEINERSMNLATAKQGEIAEMYIMALDCDLGGREITVEEPPPDIPP